MSDVAWHLCAVFAYFIMHVVAYSLMWYLAFGSASAEHSAGAQCVWRKSTVIFKKFLFEKMFTMASFAFVSFIGAPLHQPSWRC